ncbi:MAG: phosphoribosylanthranilate isomerase [Firmicutes bacterium HGW-Firmicutes-15]|nr:MAG: phosphoribosylanthranilate isomerase [Firmicutes bacterium HGW-Firmicutes-15]
MTKVKICGMRSLQDAQWAIASGAWAVGFVFASSPRQVTVDEAASIIRELPPSLHKVGVFVDMNMELVNNIVSDTGIDMLQFHGQESPEYCQEWHLPVIKSFRIRDENSLTEVEKYQVFAHLFDTYSPGSVGGTGKIFDWRLLDNFQSGLRIVLAGGLNPSNVAGAIRRIKPYAVDVSSGVESSGRKDQRLINEFIGQVQQ